MQRHLEIEAALRRLTPAFGTAAWPPAALRLPKLRVAVSGAHRVGKTTASRALMGLSTGGQPVARTRVAVEYQWGERCQLSVERPGCPKQTVVQLSSGGQLDRALQAIDVAHQRVTVDIDSPALRDSELVVVDLPPVGLEERLDAVALKEASGASAVLHVLDERGLAEADLRYLRALKVPFVAVASIRDDALEPTRSAVEPYLVDLPGAVQRTALPIVLPDAVTDGPERTALLAAVGSLRRAQLLGYSRETLQRMAESVALLRLERADGAERALDAAIALAREGALERRLEALARLLELERSLADGGLPADAVLATAAAFLEKTAAEHPEAIAQRESDRADALRRSYNRRAAGRPRAASGAEREVSAGPRPEFGTFVEPRLELRRVIANCLDAAQELSMTPAERALLEELDREVEDGRVEIALLGMFSSGKSALINALLGVEIDDLHSRLLPTSVKVETATINRVEYAAKPQLNGVDWLEQVALTLLEYDPGAGATCYRVHEQELRAIESWLQSGALSIEDCDMVELGGTARDERPRKRDKVRALQRTVESCRDEVGYRAYVDGGAGLVARVRIRRFARPPPALEPGQSLQTSLQALKDPALALRARMVHIGYPSELLKHAAFIDTPGTDSHVPHHRATAQGIVKQKNVPVLYCFMGSQAAGLEDRRNLEVLVAGGEDALRRVFFVVTRKGTIKAERERDEVRTRVREKLGEAGLLARELFFIELKGPVDPEFVSLRRQVEAFVFEEQGPQLRAWVSRGRAVATSAGERARRQRADLDLQKKEREARVKVLGRKITKVQELEEEMQGREWGRAHVEKRVQEVIGEHEDELLGIFESLGHQDTFQDLDSTLDGAFETLEEEATHVLERGKRFLLGKLASELGTMNLSVTSPSLKPRKAFFDGSGAVQAARDIDWPFTFPVWLWGKREVIKENHDSVKEPAEAAVGQGRKDITSHLSRWTSGLRTQLQALAEGLAAEREMLTSLDPTREARERERLIRAIEASRRWVTFFDNLEADDGPGRRKR